jgi:hypothetical protein
MALLMAAFTEGDRRNRALGYWGAVGLDLAITADPLEPDRVNNYECWESEDALASWRPIANKTTSPFG